MSVEPCKLNIGETSYQVSKSFIDALDDLIEKAKYASGFEDNWDNSVMELVETDLWKAISAVRNNEIVDFHTKRTEMKVRPDNKHLTDKEKLAIKSKRGIHKYMKCHKCLCVITKKEEQAHYKRKKCMKTFKQRTHNAVITIQRWARYCVHKKKYLKQQKKIAKKIVKKQNKKERHSARKIQSLWRGYVYRKNLRDTADIADRVVNTAFQLAIQNAIKPQMIKITKFQALWRGYVCRKNVRVFDGLRGGVLPKCKFSTSHWEMFKTEWVKEGKIPIIRLTAYWRKIYFPTDEEKRHSRMREMIVAKIWRGKRKDAVRRKWRDYRAVKNVKTMKDFTEQRKRVCSYWYIKVKGISKMNRGDIEREIARKLFRL